MSSYIARLSRLVASVAFALALAIPAAATAAAADAHVVVLPATGVVDNVMASYLHDGIARAADAGASAVVVELDTPGGSLDSMREIVKTFEDAPLPVIVWVGPPGSRAASAGTFITLAANLALMAPSTNIGAASPVGSQGQDIGGTEGQKVMQDAIATITGIAQLRSRNVDWAVTTVRDARSYTVDEAIAAHAVDGKADSLPAVLAFATGRTVQIRGQQVTLQLTGASTDEQPLNALQRFLHLLADPNIAFVLFTIGTYGLLYELIHPNFVTGTIGAIAIILAFLGFGSLPLNVGGLLLIGLGVVLFVLEVTVTSHGLLTVAGLVCFALGAGALYTVPGPIAPDAHVSIPLIAGMTAATAGFMALIVAVAVRTRNRPALPMGLGGGSGGVLPAGTEAEVRAPLTPMGSVYAAGEEWSARAADGEPLPRGTQVSVVGQDGLVLVVKARWAPPSSG